MARFGLKVYRGVLRDFGPTWIDDDQLAATPELIHEPAPRRTGWQAGIGVPGVDANEHDRFRRVEPLQWRPPRPQKRLHDVLAALVYGVGVEPHIGADGIKERIKKGRGNRPASDSRLCAPIAGHRARTMLGNDMGDLPGDLVERHVTAHGLVCPVRAPTQRLQQAIRVSEIGSL